jgi:hypothetical protein
MCSRLPLIQGIEAVSWTERLKPIWGDPVWSKVISWAIIALLVLLGSYWVGAWPTIENHFRPLTSYAAGSSSIPNWIILIGAISFLFTVAAITKHLWLRFSPPGWKDYTSDEILGINWRWRWDNNAIAGLIAFCPTCDMEVSGYTPEYTEFQTDFYCDRCNRSLQTLNMEPQYIADRVIREIERKVRTGEWRAAVAQSRR